MEVKPFLQDGEGGRGLTLGDPCAVGATETHQAWSGIYWDAEPPPPLAVCQMDRISTWNSSPLAGPVGCTCGLSLVWRGRQRLGAWRKQRVLHTWQ